jgi:hypothetical protein
VKTKVLFVATFAVGVIVGVISQHIPVHTPTTLAQTAPTLWPDTEEDMLKRINGFQERLDELEKVRPDNVEALSKQMEAQRGIEDLLTKYREAKQAKFAPYIGASGTLAAAIVAGIGTWLVARRKSKRTPDASLQTEAAAR